MEYWGNHASKGIISAPMSSGKSHFLFHIFLFFMHEFYWELEIPWTCVEGLGAPMRLRHGFVECLAKNNTQNCAWNMCPFIDDTTISVLTCDEEKMEAKHGWCAQAKHELHEIFRNLNQYNKWIFNKKHFRKLEKVSRVIYRAFYSPWGGG